MTLLDLETVNNCTSCSSSLERGHTTYYKGDKAVEKVCFVCSRKRDLQEFIKSKRLRSHFLMTAFCKLYDIPLVRDIIDQSQEDTTILVERLDRIRFIAKHNSPPGLPGCDLPYEELRAYLEAQIGSSTLQSLAKRFEEEVWFAGLQNKVLNTRERGVSAHPDRDDKLVVLTYTLAGRTMITIENNENRVTFITSDTGHERVMGLQGADATTDSAVDLVTLTISLYKEGKLDFTIDKKVGLF